MGPRTRRHAAENRQLETTSQTRPSNNNGLLSATAPPDRKLRVIHVEEEDDDAPLTAAKHKAHPETSDEDDDVVLPAKRRRLRGGPNSSQTDAMEDSDNGMLVVEARDDTESSRFKSPAKRTPRKLSRSAVSKKKAFAKLKGRRAGEHVSEDESSSDDDDGIPVYDTDNSLSALEEFPDDPEGVEGDAETGGAQSTPAKKSNKKGSRNGTPRDEPASEESSGDSDDIEDFIVEDDEIGVPLDFQESLPAHLRPRLSKKERFADAIDWLVQRRVNPAFDRNAPRYQDAWRTLDDELRGLALSKFASSAWNPEFVRALSARPIYTMHPIPPGDFRRGETCNACNRINHPSLHYMTLRGKPYKEETLEELARNADSSDDEVRDDQGKLLMDEEHEWVLGSVCANNAENFHRLRHWRWTLGKAVDEQLINEDRLFGSFEERVRWPVWKSERLAKQIMTNWKKRNGLLSGWLGEFRKLRETGEVTKTTQRR